MTAALVVARAGNDPPSAFWLQLEGSFWHVNENAGQYLVDGPRVPFGRVDLDLVSLTPGQVEALTATARAVAVSASVISSAGELETAATRWAQVRPDGYVSLTDAANTMRQHARSRTKRAPRKIPQHQVANSPFVHALKSYLPAQSDVRYVVLPRNRWYVHAGDLGTICFCGEPGKLTEIIALPTSG